MTNLSGPWPFPDRNLRLESPGVILSPVDLTADIDALYRAAAWETNGEDLFLYHVNVGPFSSQDQFAAYLIKKAEASGEVLYKVFSPRLGRPVGCLSLMNIKPDHGTLEVGSIWYERAAQRTEVNSQAIWLLFEYVFETLGYRRFEWKCNNLNEASKAAALRLGFEYEGLFRNHMVSRGQNRDTAWFAMTDQDWSAKREALRTKLLRV